MPKLDNALWHAWSLPVYIINDLGQYDKATEFFTKNLNIIPVS